MLETLKIIKINILSIIALPLLIISTILKVIIGLVENVFTVIAIIIMFCLTIGVVIMLGSLFNGDITMGEMVMMCALFTLAFLVIRMAFYLIVAIPLLGVLMAFEFISAIVVSITESITAFYINLYIKLLEQYEQLKTENILLNFFSYIFLNILNTIHNVLKNIFLYFKFISATVFFIGIYKIYTFLNNDTLKSENLTFVEYVFAQDTAIVVTSIILIIVTIVCIILILMLITDSMVEYGKILELVYNEEYEKFEYDNYKNIDYFKDVDFNVGNSNIYEDDFIELTNKFEEMTDEFESLMEKVNLAIEIKENILLIQKFNRYADTLNKISEKIRKENTEKIKYKNFVIKYNNDINSAMKLRESIYKIVLETLGEAGKAYNNSSNESSYSYNNEDNIFFKGCDTEEKLKKTYRKLCKTYHPDEGGDIDTFKKITAEYESLLKAIQS